MTAIAATRRSYRELVDGTLRVQIDVEPNDKAGFLQMFPEPGAPMGLAALKPVDAVWTPSQPLEAAPVPSFGEYAKALRLNGFCRAPEVWRAVGTDAEFLGWLRGHPCHVIGSSCNGDVVAAHVRRIANGAGTAIKPEYSAIPLCDHHHKLQHAHGESAVMLKEEWDKARIEYVEDWCWDTLKAVLGKSTMAAVSPQELLGWAQKHSVDRYLPACYREAA